MQAAKLPRSSNCKTGRANTFVVVAGKPGMRDLEEFRGRSAAPRDGGERTASSSSTPWWSGDPEAKRRRRVAAYKAYAVEARVKASLRRGFRWIKGRFVRRW
ncbi:hypothetical protein E2562_013994 [Oryza meyeriana var. granulata]|uniref:Uncharacterized protein n=1 Tax=Oryza meyeriana var. granulata TaxID=110450 RepID=A0A6G1DJD7_9ORYZ|nr:hypothetical protein E2562_013994 [Oryza meyeriana var. granulata]